jgi:hypothetical protein
LGEQRRPTVALRIVAKPSQMNGPSADMQVAQPELRRRTHRVREGQGRDRRPVQGQVAGRDRYPDLGRQGRGARRAVQPSCQDRIDRQGAQGCLRRGWAERREIFARLPSQTPLSHPPAIESNGDGKMSALDRRPNPDIAAPNNKAPIMDRSAISHVQGVQGNQLERPYPQIGRLHRY